MKSFKCFIGILVLALGIQGCSFKSADMGHVTVTFPKAQPAVPTLSSTMEIGQAMPMAMPAPTDLPSSLDGFTCFGVNVTGNGIPPNAAVNNPSQSCSGYGAPYVGTIGGLASVSGGTVDLLVPAGRQRLFQLFGLISTIGCQSFQQLVSEGLIDNKTGSGGNNGMSDPIFLGSATTDVIGDTSLSIKAGYSSSTAQKEFCDGGGNGYNNTLAFQEQSYAYGQTEAVGFGASCQPIALTIPAGATSSFQVNVLDPNGTGFTLYNNATDCAATTNAINNTTITAGPGGLSYVYSVGATAGSVVVSVANPTNGYIGGQTTIKVVSSHVFGGFSCSGDCCNVMISGGVTANVIATSAYNDLSTLYSDAGCTTAAMQGVSFGSSGGWVYPGITGYNYYLKATSGESYTISFIDPTGANYPDYISSAAP